MIGKLVIGTEIDTKNFDKEITYLEAKLNDIRATLEMASKDKTLFGTNEIKQMEAEAEKLENRLVDLKKKQAKASTFDLSGISSGITNVVKKVGKWAIAVFGIRSAYMAVRNAINVISQNDAQLKADIDYIKNAFAYSLEPIIRKIVELAKQLMVIIQNIAYRITGKNIFANANKSLQSANKEASKLKKTMAGFDEMNVLSDTSSSGSTGTPSMDLSKMQSLGNIGNIVKEKWQEMINTLENTDWKKIGQTVYGKIKSFFTDINWGEIFNSIFEGIGAVIGALAGVIVGLLDQAWTDIKNYFKKWINQSKENGGSVVEGLLLGIWNAIKNIGKWIWDHIFKPFIDGFKKAFGIHSPSTVMQEMGGYLVEGFKNGLSNIWGKTKAIFENLKTKIIEIFNQTWEGIKKAFSNVKLFFTNIITTIVGMFKSIGTKVGDAIGGAFRSVINAVLSRVESILNTPINGINKLLNKINTLPGVNIGKLSTFSFPRLAKGGIVNMPGRGVPIGGAIAGERGREAVMPLQDSQVLDEIADAIGRRIVLQPTIPIYIGHKMVAKEMKTIDAEEKFAYNG